MPIQIQRPRTELGCAARGLLLLSSLGLIHCGEPLVVLDLDPASVPSTVTQLVLESQLGGDYGQAQTFPGSARRIAVHLPDSASGTVQLSLAGLNSAGCKSSQSTVMAEVPGGLSRAHEISVTLAPLSKQFCPAAFGAAANFTAGIQPVSAAASDFNLDGKVDLVVANEQGFITLSLGDGTGRFAAPTNIPVVNNTFGVVSGDFNVDGKPDFAVVGNGLNVFLGNGTGAFNTPNNYAVGGQRLIATGDFNADGKPDLIVAEYANSNLNVLLGNGAGTFGTPITTMNMYVNSMAIGDFNKDGKQDLIIIQGSNVNTVNLLLGDGQGRFSQGGTFIVDKGANWVTSADFNNDGNIDVAVATYTGGDVSVLLGNGAGGFGPYRGYSVPRSGNDPASPTALTVGDFNGDGVLDIACALYGNITSRVGILLGDGMGTFVPMVQFPVATGEPQFITTGDFDGDKKPDLVVITPTNANFSVLLNRSR